MGKTCGKHAGNAAKRVSHMFPDVSRCYSVCFTQLENISEMFYSLPFNICREMASPPPRWTPTWLDRAGGGRVRVTFWRFWVAQTSGEVYLKQNLMGKLIFTSKNSQLLQNLPKITKNRKKLRNKFRIKNIRRQKIESCKSSETRFPEVSRRSERSSRFERTFEVRRANPSSRTLQTAEKLQG